MNKIFNKIVIAFWGFDIMNLPFMEIFDTTYPINFWAYTVLFSLWYFIPAFGAAVSANAKSDDTDE